MSRGRRRLLVAVLVLIAGLATLFALARHYLASERVAAVVASKLEAAYGGMVQVGAADIGLERSTVHGLKLFEAKSGPDAKPWAVVDEVKADISALSLARGQTLPKEIALVGADITLRFDQANHLLTELPKPHSTATTLPVFRLEQGKITILQQGRPNLVVSGIDAALRSEGDSLVISGTASDPTWGQWSLQGNLDSAAGRGALALKAGRTHVTQKLLEQLPFVSPDVWKQVQCEGDTPVDLTIRFGPATNEVHYRVALEPEATSVHVSSIDLFADQASGKVVIEDKVVTLTDVQGHAADGTIKTHGTLDFKSTPSQLTFRVEAEGLELRRLPRSWSLPPQINGRLAGHADLVLVIVNGKARTNGDGRGTITKARIGKVPVSRPIELTLHADGQRFRFSQPTPPADTGMGKISTLLVPVAIVALANGGREPPVEQDSGGPYPPLASTAVQWLGTNLLRAIQAGVEGTTSLLSRLPKGSAAPAKPATEPNYLEVNLALDLVEIDQLIQGLGVKLPLALKGKVSFRVQAALPIDNAKDLRAYRVRGSASSPHLTVEGMELDQLRARVVYADGVLRLEELAGQIPPSVAAHASGPAGTFHGSARLEVIPQGNLSGRLTLDRIPLAQVLAVVPSAYAQAVGDLAGHFDLTADVKGTLKPFAVQSSGTGTVSDLKLKNLAVGSVQFRWQNDADRLRITDVKAALYNGELSGSAIVPLRPSGAGTVDLRFKDLDVAALEKAVPGVPVRLEGRATGSFEGALNPVPGGKGRMFSSKLDLQAPQLRVQGVPAERLRGTVDYHNDTIDYRLDGDTLGGKFHLNGQIPPAQLKPQPQQPQQGRLTIEGVRLSQLGPALRLGTALDPLGGRVDLDLSFQHTGPSRLPTGTGRFSVRGLRWGQNQVATTVAGDLVLTEGELRLRNLSGQLSQGLLRGGFVFNLRQFTQSRFTLALDHVDSARLLAPWPALAGRVQGLLDIRLRGQLGRVWFGGAEISFAHGRIAGVDVNDWHLPLDWSFVPGRGVGQVVLHENVATVALGRVSNQATLSWGAGLEIDGRLRFADVELRTLLHQVTDLTQVGSGRITGRLNFSGTNVHSMDDLKATLEARLQQTQALQMPILQQLTPFLIPGQGASTQFQNGDVRARLASGLIRVDRLSFAGSNLQFLLEGNMTLEGRLNLEATASTSQLGINPNFLRLLRLRIPLTGPIPVGLLMEASTYLSNRLIHARITGTVRVPVITIEPTTLLTEEAVQFFVNRAGLPVP